MARQPTRPAVGVVLLNLGTPDAPTARAVRRYLAEFLSDPRVVDLPPLLWQPLLRLVILPLRSPRSARLYRSIWTAGGSPLLVTTRQLAAGLEAALTGESGDRVQVVVAMRYGRPSIEEALTTLEEAGCRRLLALPLYPQYSSTTTGSSLDALTAALARLAPTLEWRAVDGYHDRPGYVAALAASLRELWGREGDPERLLVSFHGLPERFVAAGDPYPAQCEATARLIATELELPPERWQLAYQSRFGPGAWLEPATTDTLRSWGTEGVGLADVVCPGFAVDCLETLDEIAIAGRRVFESAGGRRLRYVPALNNRPDHVAALAEIAREALQGWV